MTENNKLLNINTPYSKIKTDESYNSNNSDFYDTTSDTEMTSSENSVAGSSCSHLIKKLGKNFNNLTETLKLENTNENNLTQITEDLNNTFKAKNAINYQVVFSDFSRNQDINEANRKIEEYKNKFNGIINKIDIKKNKDYIHRLFVVLLSCSKIIYSNDYDFNKREVNLELINNFKKLFENCFEKIKGKLRTIDYSFNDFIEDIKNRVKENNKNFDLQNDIDKKLFITFITDIILNLFDDINIDTIFDKLFKNISNIKEITTRPEIFPNDGNNMEQHIKKYIACKFLNKYPNEKKYLKYFENDFASTNNKFFEHYIKNTKYDDLQYFITNTEYFSEINNLFFKNINIENDKFNYQTTYFIEFFINKNDILSIFLENLKKNKNENVIEKIFEIILKSALKIKDFDYTIFDSLIEKDLCKKILVQLTLNNNNNTSLQKYLIAKIKNKTITNEYFTNTEQNKLFWLIVNNKEELNGDIDVESINSIIKYNTQFQKENINENLELYLLNVINNFNNGSIDDEQIKNIVKENNKEFIKILYNNSEYISSEKLFKIIKEFEIEDRELLEVYEQNNNPEKITKNSLNRINYNHLSNFEKVLMLKLFGFKEKEINQKIESMNNGKFSDLINFENFGYFIDRYNKSEKDKNLYLKFFLEKIVYCNIDDSFIQKFILSIYLEHLFGNNLNFNTEDFNINKTELEDTEKFYKFYFELIKEKKISIDKIFDTSYKQQFNDLEELLKKNENKEQIILKLNSFFENFLYKFEVLKYPEYFIDKGFIYKKNFKNLYKEMQKLLSDIDTLVNENNILDQNIKNNFNKLKDYINDNILEKDETEKFVKDIEIKEILDEVNKIKIISETFKEKYYKNGKMVKNGKHLIFEYNEEQYSFEVPIQPKQSNNRNLLENNKIDINSTGLYKYNKGSKIKGIHGTRQEIKIGKTKQKILDAIINKLYILKNRTDNQQNYDLLININDKFKELLEDNLTSMRNLN